MSARSMYGTFSVNLLSLLGVSGGFGVSGVDSFVGDPDVSISEMSWNVSAEPGSGGISRVMSNSVGVVRRYAHQTYQHVVDLC